MASNGRKRRTRLRSLKDKGWKEYTQPKRLSPFRSNESEFSLSRECHLPTTRSNARERKGQGEETTRRQEKRGDTTKLHDE